MQPIEPNAMLLMLVVGVYTVVLFMFFMSMHPKIKHYRNQCAELRNEIAASDEAHDEAIQSLISLNVQYVHLTNELLVKKTFYKSMLQCKLQCKQPTAAPAAEINMKQALKVVCEALKNDHELYNSWQSNIAAVFVSIYYQKRPVISKTDEEIDKIANKAAKIIIDQLIC